MITRYEAWLDAIPLSGIDPAIYITDIQEKEPIMNVVTVARSAGDGLFTLRRSREALSVQIKFQVREYDTARRKDIAQKIAAWAKNGGMLAISDRPRQVLRVEMDAAPRVTSALKWTQELSLTLTAYAFPYWQEDTPEELQTGGTASIMVQGDAPRAMVDAVVNASASTVSVSVGDQTITLADISTGPLEIRHGDDGILRILSNGAPVLSKRTTNSADDLFALPGEENTFSVSGGTATFYVRGAWL